MPRYKVLKTGFLNGIVYDPNGKRTIVHRDKSFPNKKGTKKENVPSWLKLIKEEAPAARAKRETAEQEKARLDAEKLAQDEQEKATFLNPETGESTVETL